jgi:hypothetical protein
MAIRQTAFVPPTRREETKGHKSKKAEILGKALGVAGGIAGGLAGTAGTPAGVFAGATAGAAGGMSLGRQIGEMIDPSRAGTSRVIQDRAVQTTQLGEGSTRTRHLSSALDALQRQSADIQQEYGEPLMQGYIASLAVDKGGQV